MKRCPCGSPIQAVLDGLEALRNKHPFNAARVREVVVRLATDEAAIVDNREIPDICLQHVVAVALLAKSVTFASVHETGRLTDPATLQTRSKVRLLPDRDLQRLLPLLVANVVVTLM